MLVSVVAVSRCRLANLSFPIECNLTIAWVEPTVSLIFCKLLAQPARARLSTLCLNEYYGPKIPKISKFLDLLKTRMRVKRASEFRKIPQNSTKSRQKSSILPLNLTFFDIEFHNFQNFSNFFEP